MIIEKLNKHQTLTISNPQRVNVVNGFLWVTYTNNNRDYFYKTGDTFEITKYYSASIKALEETQITLVNPIDNKKGF